MKERGVGRGSDTTRAGRPDVPRPTCLAFEEYAHYVCDKCGEVVGPTGFVTLRDRIVWEIVCVRCNG